MAEGHACGNAALMAAAGGGGCLPTRPPHSSLLLCHWHGFALCVNKHAAPGWHWRGGGHGRGPALECAAGSAGRGAAYPNYLPIITTMPLICYHLQIGGIQLNSLLAKTHANHVFTWVSFLHGRPSESLNKQHHSDANPALFNTNCGFMLLFLCWHTDAGIISTPLDCFLCAEVEMKRF